MKDHGDDARAKIRLGAYGLLIAVALGGAVGRIATVASPDGETPFLSANDKSRWCAIRALGDHGTHIIDDVIIRNPQGKTSREKFDKRWYSIDMVRHRGHDGLEHYYSSKPTLLTTLLAGEYQLVKLVTGANLAEHPLYVGRIMLVLTNVLPLGLCLWLLSRLIERYGVSDWGRLFAMTAATFATFLTTFAVTLNNHLIAAVCVTVAVYASLPICLNQERKVRYFFVAGCGAALAAANELPALSFLALVGAVLFWKAPLRTIIGFAPPAVVVAAAALGTNYLAHGSWKTPYAHRQDGEMLATVPSHVADELAAAKISDELRAILEDHHIDLSPEAVVLPTTSSERLVIWDRDGHDRLAIVRESKGWQVRAWDNWYDYSGSYWTDERKQGVDRGEPSRLVYALHVLIGHHGVFSLTPIWLLSAAGIVLLAVRRGHSLSGVAAATALLTLVCIGFYISRPLEDRNYGGVSCGLRWLFWLIPLWLLCLLPAVDAIASRRIWQGGALVLLIVSALSAGYAALNPWSHPWIYEYWEYLGWISS